MSYSSPYCYAVLLGWRGRPRRQNFVFGSNVDEVITKARSDVLVERIGERLDGVEDIMLPTAGGTHVEFAAEVARAIARVNNSTVHVTNVVGPGTSESDREDAQEKIDRVRDVLGDEIDIDSSIIDDDDVVDAIVKRTGEFDLTLLGATREGLFQQLLFGTIPEQVGERAENTVIMAKRSTGLRTWMKRWFTRRNR